MVRVPRFNECTNASIYCVDDCIATFSDEKNLIYQAMYLDELDIGTIENRDGFHFFFENHMLYNLREYGGIVVTDISEDSFMLKEIEKAVDSEKTVLLEIRGVECPWDWRYKDLDWGNHTFLLTGKRGEHGGFVGKDPYYEIEHIEISKMQLMKGCISAKVLTADLPKEDALYFAAIDKILSVKSFRKRSDDFTNCVIFKMITKEIEKLQGNGTFDDFHIENCNLLQNLLNCTYSRLRFAILLNYLRVKGKFNYSSDFVEKYVEIANMWDRIRKIVIRSILSSRNNDEILIGLVKSTCNLEDKALEELRHLLVC